MAVPAEAIGSFPGSITTMFKWSPDPDDVAAALVSVARYLENMKAPLRASRHVIQQDIKERFDTETDPEGNAWRPLNEKYRTQKLNDGYPDRILVREGDLQAGAVSNSSFIIDETNGNLYFTSMNLPDYWRVHQEGVPPGNIGASELSRRAAEILGMVDEGENVGAGNNIPMRPYIGVSDDAQERIFNIFDLWFFAGTSIKVSSSGVLQQSVGGRFGPTIHI